MKNVNLRFFFLSFLFPLSIITSGLLLISFLVIFPYLEINASLFFENSFVPIQVKEQAGFSPFSFSELTLASESSESASLGDTAIPETFTLSVPKLSISNAIVEANSKNLNPDKMLGHYFNTALPGQRGNVFIYGHSVLPIFYNPKDYKTIFSKLPELKDGDAFSIIYNGTVFNYQVVKTLTLKPDDVNVFDSNPAKLSGEVRTVTLMTCVPPGSKTYRMLVIGKLVD